ncbi:MAG: hypothetical protein Q8N40_01885 [Bradyrhizobium sp.]|nr:hypothetical protein [Bradyrhizobium sp.]MDP3074363.1 hypothetical protein [Bradyrhizobium sp.]
MSWFINVLLGLAAKDRTHAIDILERLIQSGSKTHRSFCDKAGDAVVANAVDDAARDDKPLAAGGLRGKRGADRLGAAAVLSVFQFVRLDGAHSARVVVELLGLSDKPWVLAIDRTNWDFGKTTINILMISVTWNGMGIPLPVDGAANRGKFEHLRTNRASGSPARGISEHEDCGTDGRSRVYWRCMDGLSAAREDRVYPASARKPACAAAPAMRLCRSPSSPSISRSGTK